MGHKPVIKRDVCHTFYETRAEPEGEMRSGSSNPVDGWGPLIQKEAMQTVRRFGERFSREDRRVMTGNSWAGVFRE